ncbi:MAG: SGNH/GDSL hydrolase family protein [Oscillospiraceae bacterium]|nr:SGNH/GDSL hydrolase family protein [Oscillospiraceae bacterium]
MSKLKFLLLISLGFVFLLSAVSCSNSGASSESSSDSSDTVSESSSEPESSASEPEKPVTQISFTVGDSDISDFDIVYAESPTEYYDESLRSILYGELNKDFVNATRLSDLIFKYTGTRLEIYKDVDYSRSDKKIIAVGNTDLRLTSKPSVQDEFVVKLTDSGDLAICGGIEGTTWHAIDNIESLLSSCSEKNEPAAITASSELSGSYHIKRIACVGDSITAGCGSTDYRYISYPENLNRTLWRDYYFITYAVAGTTTRSDLADAYKNTPQYKTYINGAIKYDAVIVMLGINDSIREAAPWAQEGKDNFIAEFKDMFYKTHEFSENEKFIIMNCSVTYAGWITGAQYIRNIQLAIAKELYKDYPDNIVFYDMFQYSKANMPNSMFADGLHPNDEGHNVMSDGVGQMIQDVFNANQNEYFVDLG